MKHIYILLFAMTLALSAVAQADYKPGYIQKTDGSIQQGLLDYRGESRLSQKLTFKRSTNSQEEVFEPGQLQGYGFDGGKRYEAHTIAGADSVQQLSFLEVLVKGPANLYFANQNGVGRFFIRKGAQPLMELVHEKRRVEKAGKVYYQDVKLYIGTLTYVFSDCKEVQPQLERIRFQQSDLAKITAMYNQYMAPGEDGFVKETEKKLEADIAIVAGVGITKANFSGSNNGRAYLINGNHVASYNPTFGILFDLKAYKVSEKVSLNTGVLFSTYKVEGDREEAVSATIREHYAYTLNASYLKMPLLLRYTYPKGTIRPFASAGVQHGLLIRADSKVEETSFLYQSTRVTEQEAITDPRKYEFGMLGSIGATTGLAGKTKLSVEARFENNNGLSPYLNLKQKNHTGSLLVGIVF